jgi:tRNA(His) guanylyltransferase
MKYWGLRTLTAGSLRCRRLWKRLIACSGGDAIRNAISAFARTLFSDKEMHRKTTNELLGMMRVEMGFIFEESVPKWAIEGCLVKREQVEQEGVNSKTGQKEKALRTRTGVRD